MKRAFHREWFRECSAILTMVRKPTNEGDFMNNMITPLRIDTAPDVPGPDADSIAAGRARRRADRDFARAHAGLGARVVHRLVCALAGVRA